MGGLRDKDVIGLAMDLTQAIYMFDTMAYGLEARQTAAINPADCRGPTVCCRSRGRLARWGLQ